MSGNILYNLIYALVFGFTEFLGVDAVTHDRVFELLTGQKLTLSILPVFIRLGLIVALLISCWPRLRRLMREQSYASRSRRLKRPPDPIAKLDLRLLRTAILPIIVGVILYTKTRGLSYGFFLMSLVLLMNAVILYIPRLINSGNKDGRSASPFDGLLLGFGGLLGFIPGLSRMGCMITTGAVAGLDRSYCLDMSLVLSIPALLGILIMDVIGLIAAKTVISMAILAAGLLYMLAAVLGGWLSIIMMRYLSIKIGYSGFAYYSLGLGLFSFVFYLVI